MLRSGFFDAVTGFRPLYMFKLFSFACSNDVEVIAWLTFEKKKKSVFDEERGRQLGKALNQFFDVSCLKGIELYFDAFPYDKLAGLGAYLEAARATLSSGLSLYLHTPSIQETGLSSEKALRLLKHVDGFNISLVNTIAKDDAGYLKVIDGQVEFVQAVMAQKMKKRFNLGVVSFPSQKSWESSENFYSYLLHMPDSKLDVFCSGTLDVAFFASYLMDDHRRGNAGKIDRWIRDACKKRKKK